MEVGVATDVTARAAAAAVFRPWPCPASAPVGHVAGLLPRDEESWRGRGVARCAASLVRRGCCAMRGAVQGCRARYAASRVAAQCATTAPGRDAPNPLPGPHVSRGAAAGAWGLPSPVARRAMRAGRRK
eukprot:354917-Chlamydomonas_euryale.AAC.17